MNKTNYLLCVHETIRQILRQIRLQEPAALVVKKECRFPGHPHGGATSLC